MSSSVAKSSAKLAIDLSHALLGQESFALGRPEARPALGRLFDSLTKQFNEHEQIALLAGRPDAPLDFLGWGFSPTRTALAELLPVEAPAIAGFWRERRLLLLSLRRGLTRQEFDRFFHLMTTLGDRGPALRKRWFEEQLRGNLSHATLLFVDELCDFDQGLPWPTQIALAWLLRDLNRFFNASGIPDADSSAGRQTLLDAVLALVSGPGELRELLAQLDRVAENLHDYDRDELAGLVLARLAPPMLGTVCLELCGALERLQQRIALGNDPLVRERLESFRWMTRRVAEQLIDGRTATPAHYHALVLQKVLLYEEIPGAMRAPVATLQVLTSFLVNPQKCFAEIEGSHSPEVLEKRLWRLLEMLPNMLRVLRFDAVREVAAFVQRFGPTFELFRNQELMVQVREAAAEVLAAGDAAQQAELMKTLPQLGRTGLHLLIDLADHSQRAVRRVALDGLCAAGPTVVPVLFEILERKPGWHYLRNMLVILGKVEAGGPKIEGVFRQALEHPEPAIRKEALPGLARLCRENAAELVAGRLDDPDPEVRRRAILCLGLTGIADPQVYERLATFLTTKSADDQALAVVATLNRLRPGERAGTCVETGLIDLVSGGWFGIGKGSADRSLRIEATRALGQFSSGRARKALERLLKESDAGVARAAREALTAGS